MRPEEIFRPAELMIKPPKDIIQQFKGESLFALTQ